jgi:hypothetical protein
MPPRDADDTGVVADIHRRPRRRRYSRARRVAASRAPFYGLSATVAFRAAIRRWRYRRSDSMSESTKAMRTRLSFAGTVLLIALVSSLWAWWLIATPVMTLSPAGIEKHAGHFRWAYVHVLGGTLMLFLGLANLYIGSTRRFFRYHKLIGRMYLVGGGLGTVAAVIITSSVSHKGSGVVDFQGVATFTNTTIALLTLSAAWLLAAGMAYRAARNRRYDSHREWMIRSYVLVWAFVFCRLASRVQGVEDLGGGNAFIWLSWVGPLLLCELVLQWRAGSRNPSKGAPVRGAAQPVTVAGPE